MTPLERQRLSGDRTVHAKTEDGEIVRYDRAGKWYIEWDNGERTQITVKEAANWVVIVADDATINFGLPGGSAFDRHVMRITNRRSR